MNITRAGLARNQYLATWIKCRAQGHNTWCSLGSNPPHLETSPQCSRENIPSGMCSIRFFIRVFVILALRKHAYSNILKILQPKKENFQVKNSDIFHVSAQNIDCWYSLEPPRRDGSNEYQQSMCLSRNKKKQCIPL